MKNEENHCCDELSLPLDKYLQKGSGIGRGILAIGESPALNGWMKSGRAFYTTEGRIVPTGKNFLINLKQINPGLDLNNIYFTEISKCYIGSNRKKLINCATKTWPHFIEQINYVNPRLIILLGKKTTEIFNKLAGTNLIIGDIQQIELSGSSYSFLPIYHPSPLNPKRIQNTGFIETNKLEINQLIF